VPELEREDGVASWLAISPADGLAHCRHSSAPVLARDPRRNFPEPCSSSCRCSPSQRSGTRRATGFRPFPPRRAGGFRRRIASVPLPRVARASRPGAAAILVSIATGAWNTRVSFDSPPDEGAVRVLIGGVLVSRAASRRLSSGTARPPPGDTRRPSGARRRTAARVAAKGPRPSRTSCCSPTTPARTAVSPSRSPRRSSSRKPRPSSARPSRAIRTTGSR
jgi:hypothetical protein